jgi:hypothetical protein
MLQGFAFDNYTLLFWGINKHTLFKSSNCGKILKCSRMQPTLITPVLKRGRPLTSSHPVFNFGTEGKCRLNGTDCCTQCGPLFVFCSGCSEVLIGKLFLIGIDEVVIDPFDFFRRNNADNVRIFLFTPEGKEPKWGLGANQDIAGKVSSSKKKSRVSNPSGTFHLLISPPGVGATSEDVIQVQR